MTPDDEYKRREEVKRAQWAKQLLDNPLWNESFDVLYANIDRQWQKSQPEQSALREELYHTRHFATKFRAHVENIVTTGRMAEMQIERSTNG